MDAAAIFGLERLFHSLIAGLEAHEKVRADYDTRVAFDFSSLDFFNPDENCNSRILAFFLDPSQRHGQKDMFLRGLLEFLQLPVPDRHITENARVKFQHSTDTGRFIDITITFDPPSGSAHKRILAIENKINHNAPDQNSQLEDYASFLQFETGDDYLLLYLSPDGHSPPLHSISPQRCRELTEHAKFRCISYDRDIIDLVTKWEGTCRAENVRAFLKDFAQYLWRRYKGKTFMNQETFVEDFIRKNPEMVKYIDAITGSMTNFRKEQYDLLWKFVTSRLQSKGVDFVTAMKWIERDSEWSFILRRGSPFESLPEMNGPGVRYEPKAAHRISIGVGLKKPIQELPPNLVSQIQCFESKLKIHYPQAWIGQWWRGCIDLPTFDFWSVESLRQYLQDENRCALNAKASEMATAILKYLEVAEVAWAASQNPT